MIVPTKGVQNATNLPYSWTFSTFKWRNLRRRAMRQLKFLCRYALQAQIRRVVIRRLVKWRQASIDSDYSRLWDTALCRWTKKRQTLAVLTDKAPLCAFKPFATSKSLVILSDSEVSINSKNSKRALNSMDFSLVLLAQNDNVWDFFAAPMPFASRFLAF